MGGVWGISGSGIKATLTPKNKCCKDSQDMFYLKGYHLQNKNSQMTSFITSRVPR